MPRRPSAPSKQSDSPGLAAPGVTNPPSDAAIPTINGWDVMAFKPLRQVMAIKDPEERRAVALERLEAIQRMAANRRRPIGNQGVDIADPDGSTIIKAEEIIQRLLNITPVKDDELPQTASSLSVFTSPPKLEAVR